MNSAIPNKSQFVLSDGEVHVWNANLDLPVAFTHCQWRMLSEEETRRADKFLFVSGRRHYVCGRSILRMLLGSYLDLAPEDVAFRYGPSSKPELAPPFHHKLHFNLSHSHGQLLVAIARDFAVGVDLEMIRPEIDVDKIAMRFFSFDEIEQLKALKGSAKRKGFFNGWTRKEAYLKARGEGLGYGLDRFAVSLVPQKPARLLNDRRDSDAALHWSIREIAAAPDYAAAVSTKALNVSVKQFSWEGVDSIDRG